MSEEDMKHEPIKTSRWKQLRRNSGARLVASVLLALAVVGLSFYGGTRYQKSQQKTPPITQPAPGSPTPFGRSSTGRRGGLRGGAFGQVTAISSTSISISNRLGGTTTFTITSTTTVINNGQSASISDIKTGDTVLVRPSRSDAQQAAEITLNPTQPSAGNSVTN